MVQAEKLYTPLKSIPCLFVSIDPPLPDMTAPAPAPKPAPTPAPAPVAAAPAPTPAPAPAPFVDPTAGFDPNAGGFGFAAGAPAPSPAADAGGVGFASDAPAPAAMDMGGMDMARQHALLARPYVCTARLAVGSGSCLLALAYARTSRENRMLACACDA